MKRNDKIMQRIEGTVAQLSAAIDEQNHCKAEALRCKQNVNTTDVPTGAYKTALINMWKAEERSAKILTENEKLVKRLKEFTSRYS